ncbi:MAG: hypothetical protein ABSF25_14365 [Bryobacteraceae bacterium]|jgi:hypothetical protein
MMRGHLGSEDMCRWMAGERGAEEERHVRECSLCGAEVARMEGALQRFGGAVRAWSAAQPGAQSAGAWRMDHTSMVRPLRWGLAAAALVVLAVIPTWKSARDRRMAEEAARADDILMEQVDAQVSRTVPVTLEPLVNPVEWKAEAGQDLPGKEKGEER